MNTLSFLLGKLMRLCHSLNDCYPLVMIEFTLLTKLILLPISIWAQYNSIKIVKMYPQLFDLKIRYFGDRDTINEKTAMLYKQAKYHPFLSVIPLILQFILLLGVIEVVKAPELAGLTADSLVFRGVDYNTVAGEAGGWYVLFPIAAALSSLWMCHAQNRAQVLQSQQGAFNKYGIMIFSTGLSLYLGFFVSCSVTLYWIASNVFSILQMYLLNLAINPKKHIDYAALEKKEKEYEGMSSSEGTLTAEQKRRQKNDYRKFFSIANKHIVFYSEKSGFYKYYKRLIEWLIGHSNIVIHYVTSDPDDAVFALAETTQRIRPYFIGQKKLITLFMKMDAKIVVMTAPDLENYYLKRSYVCKDTEYIFVDHSMTSFNLTYRKKALDYYDTIFCPTRQDYDEVRAREKKYGLPPKNLVKTGYGTLEDLTDAFNAYEPDHEPSGRKTALIAPSHQVDNILDRCLDQVVEALTALGCFCIIRPHPQYVRRKPQQWDEITKRYGENENVRLEADFSSNETIYKSDLLVTDWSSIAYEYAFSTLRPCLFIDTEMKVINPDWQEIDVIPMDISLRNLVGRSAPPDDMEAIREAASDLIVHYADYRTRIEQTRDETVFNFMHSAEIGGKYILSRLKERKG